MYTIQQFYKGYESKNRQEGEFETRKKAINSLAYDLKKLIENGAEILEENENSFTFRNNDHSESITTYSVEEK